MEEKLLPHVGGGLHGYIGWVWGEGGMIPMLGQRAYIIIIYVGMGTCSVSVAIASGLICFNALCLSILKGEPPKFVYPC